MTITFNGGIAATGEIIANPNVVVLPEEIAVNAVTFDGTNDYLSRGADLTGSADSNFFTVSFWLDMSADDATAYIYINTAGQGIEINKGGDNTIAILLGNSVGYAWIANPSRTFVAADGWTHLLLSLDTSGDGANRRLYVDDAQITSWSTDVYTTGRDVDWTQADHALAATLAGTSKLNADLAEFWMTNEFIDLSMESNRRKFISAGGKPVDLESNGSGPTGTAPLVYFSGATASWHTNKGSGGGFTENGAITDASSSPSD